MYILIWKNIYILYVSIFQIVTLCLECSPGILSASILKSHPGKLLSSTEGVPICPGLLLADIASLFGPNHSFQKHLLNKCLIFVCKNLNVATIMFFFT